MPLCDILTSFPGRRATIVGDAILDRFTVGSAARLCRERPVPVVVRRDDFEFPGGAANVAANVRALGARASLVTALGVDDAGRRLRDLLRARDVDVDGIVDAPCARTARKTRIVADGQYLARVDDDPCGGDADDVQRELAARLRAAHASADALVLSDYGGGVVSAGLVRALGALQRERRVPLVIDARDLAAYVRVEADAIVPNLEEGAVLVGRRPPDARDRTAVVGLVLEIAARVRARTVALTLGGDGVAIASDGGAEVLSGRLVAVDNTCGAGDAFASALALALAAGATAREGAVLGLEAAAVAVAKPHTATVTLAELRERLDLLGTGAAASGGDPIDALLERLTRRREAGARIVLTNGVFDLLHAGHLSLLRRARALGDVLVVALNSDRSTALIKGPHRPITDVEQRRATLAALPDVDEVLVFDELTAEDVIARVRPDVYARGDDWPLEDLPEAAAAAAVGARVELLPCVGTLTTSRIIERVTARSPAWSPAVAGYFGTAKP